MQHNRGDGRIDRLGKSAGISTPLHRSAFFRPHRFQAEQPGSNSEESSFEGVRDKRKAQNLNDKPETEHRAALIRSSSPVSTTAALPYPVRRSSGRFGIRKVPEKIATKAAAHREVSLESHYSIRNQHIPHTAARPGIYRILKIKHIVIPFPKKFMYFSPCLQFTHTDNARVIDHTTKKWTGNRMN